MQQHAPDRECITLALRGDTVAAGILLNRYRPYLYALALKICGHTPVAEDAVQDAFIMAFSHLHQLNNHDSLLPWLKKIITNCCFQAMRKERPSAIKLSIDNDDHSIDNSMEEHWDHISQRDRLFKSLSQLPEALRSAMLLRYFSSYPSYEHIAEVLGIPIGTVRSRLAEGRAKLVRQWNFTEDACDTEFKAAQHWSSFYQEHWSKVYDDAQQRAEFIRHLRPNLNVVFTTGETGTGRTIIEQIIHGDLVYGSRCLAHRIISSGNISIVEAVNENSPEYPDRCPASIAFVLFRTHKTVHKMHIHHSVS